MNNDFIDVFNRFKYLKISDIASLFKYTTSKTFKKGELIAKEGEYCDSVFLILKGIIRTYVLAPDSIDRTTRLAKENQFITCAASFIHGKESTEFLEAVEDCKVIAFKTREINELSLENIRILRFLNEGLKEAFAEVVERVEFFAVLTPEQRYKKIMQESPELIQRVPQKFLASYIGVTTVSLSRIRNR